MGTHFVTHIIMYVIIPYNTVQPEILADIKFGSLAPNDVFNTNGRLKLAVWYNIAIRTCTWKKIGGF